VKIEYRIGDLLAAPVRAIAHGCNARGSMGAGIARAIARRYPDVLVAYREAHATSGLALGQVIWVDTGDRLVANCITQETYGRVPGQRYVSSEAVRACIANMNLHAAEHGRAEIGPPLIGAGLAQGHWPSIAAIIAEEARDFQPLVYTLDGVIPTA
jgi:O-acetyl-ADP-ribose deacetylase (regulator of RNase III)